MPRTVVTPAATYRNSTLSMSSRGCVGGGMWPCISARPGIRYLRWPSTCTAPSGARVVFAGPTAVMRSPVTITVWLGTTLMLSIGTTVTLVKATLFGGCATTRGDARSTIAAIARVQTDTDMGRLLFDIGAAVDVGADDRVEGLVVREPELPRAARIEQSRPGVDESGNPRIRLPPNPRRSVRSGHTLERRRHFPDRHRQAGQADGPLVSEARRRQVVRVHEAADRALGRNDPHARGRRHRADRLFAVHRLPDDAARERRSGGVGPAGPHGDGRQAERPPVDEALARVVGDQQLADGLLGPVGGLRGQRRRLEHDLGQRAAVDRNRAGEDNARAMAGGAADLEQRARAVEVHAHPEIEVRLR